MQIAKSSRHSKITGDFAENLVLYWLSKHGFECAGVDHTGIDLIARNPHTREIMGISVKGRCRGLGKEDEYLRIPGDDFDKAQLACTAFGCVPYFGIVIDAGRCVRVFIIGMDHLLRLFPRTSSGVGWKMTDRYLTSYASDPRIITFELRTDTKRWWT